MKMNISREPRQAILKQAEIKWIRKNLNRFTNIQLLKHVNAQRDEAEQLKITTFRGLLYKKGIKRNKVLRWTEEETKYLLENYKTMGNIELANNLKKRNRTFKKKNIEKKMILLGIKRTQEELDFIRNAHKSRGVYHRANLKKWQESVIKEGETKVQVINGRPQVSIKIDGRLVAYARYRWQQINGKIPDGNKVYFKDFNPLNTEDKNLICRPARGLTAEEHKEYKKHCSAYFQELKKQVHPKIPQPKKPTPILKKIAVRINSRTVVYVSPGTNINALKERYQNAIIK